MKVGIIGLGKMGLGIAERLIRHEHKVVAFDLRAEAIREAESRGAVPAYSLEELTGGLDGKPRLVWVMLPAGEPIALTLQELVKLLDDGDIIIEGGNSNYKQSMERATMLRYKGIDMLDVGVSGGIWGLEEGYNLMVGGEPEAFEKVRPIFDSLAPADGYALVGPSGAGHFVKMVHGGIEYGMMQTIAEGFELMAAKEEFDLDLATLSRLWTNGAVIRSWLLDLVGKILEEDPGLDWAEPHVPDSSEGRWTIGESIDLAVPMPVIALALQLRFRARQSESYAARLIASLYNAFDGHTMR